MDSLYQAGKAQIGTDKTTAHQNFAAKPCRSHENICAPCTVYHKTSVIPAVSMAHNLVDQSGAAARHYFVRFMPEQQRTWIPLDCKSVPRPDQQEGSTHGGGVDGLLRPGVDVTPRAATSSSTRSQATMEGEGGSRLHSTINYGEPEGSRTSLQQGKGCNRVAQYTWPTYGKRAASRPRGTVVLTQGRRRHERSEDKRVVVVVEDGGDAPSGMGAGQPAPRRHVAPPRSFGHKDDSLYEWAPRPLVERVERGRLARVGAAGRALSAELTARVAGERQAGRRSRGAGRQRKTNK